MKDKVEAGSVHFEGRVMLMAMRRKATTKSYKVMLRVLKGKTKLLKAEDQK